MEIEEDIQKAITVTVSIATFLSLVIGLGSLLFIQWIAQGRKQSFWEVFNSGPGQILIITIVFPIILMWVLDSNLIPQSRIRRIFTTTLLILGAIITLYMGWLVLGDPDDILVYIVPFLYGILIILTGYLFVKQMKFKTVVPFFLD